MSTRSSKRKFSPILDSTPIPKKVKSRAPPPRARTLEPDVLSVNELKSRIRDLKRLLRDPERLPADARIEKERALIGYESDLANAQARKERAGMIKKYHFVRFLDRKSATKRLKKLLKERETLSLSADIAAVSHKLSVQDERIHLARVDLNYTIYCPLTEKYVALYPKSTEGQEQHDKSLNPEPESELDVNAIKPQLWHAVAQSMDNGTLEPLREGKLGIGPEAEKKKKRKEKEQDRESKKSMTEQRDSNAYSVNDSKGKIKDRDQKELKARQGKFEKDKQKHEEKKSNRAERRKKNGFTQQHGMGDEDESDDGFFEK